MESRRMEGGDSTSYATTHLPTSHSPKKVLCISILIISLLSIYLKTWFGFGLRARQPHAFCLFPPLHTHTHAHTLRILRAYLCFWFVFVRGRFSFSTYPHHQPGRHQGIQHHLSSLRSFIHGFAFYCVFTPFTRALTNTYALPLTHIHTHTIYFPTTIFVI